MKLTILGSGIYVFLKDRKGPAYLLEVGDQKILLDCGWGFGPNLLEAGYTIYELDHIVISHPHADHMGGLMNITQSMKGGRHFPEYYRKKPLYLHGYKGFKKDFETLQNIMNPEKDEWYEIKIFEYEDNQNSIGELKISGVEVKHNPHLFHSSAYRIEHNGKSLAYSGDSSYDEQLVKVSNNADFALFESSNPPKLFKEQGPKPNHLSPFEAGKLAHAAGVKKLGLIHVYFHLTSEEEITEEVRKNFKGELLFPKDLQSIQI